VRDPNASGTATPGTSAVPPTPRDAPIRRSYLRVFVVWVIVLIALYAFQMYFS
jgi:hypothetical protein